MSWFRRHQHAWDEFAPFKRRCRCGREEWLFMSPYPMVDRPGAEWRDMTVAASGMETRSAIDPQGRGPKGDSPTRKAGDAQ